jgi:hypothetical protein
MPIAKPPEGANPISFLWALRFHQTPFAATKAICANPLGRFHDETSRANAIHPAGFGLGFEQRVSAFLTLNGSKLEYGFVSGGEER